MTRVREVEEKKGLLPVVAALFVSQDYKIDVKDFLDDVEHTIFRENGE